MHGCLDSLGHRIPPGVNFCTNCGEVFSAKPNRRPKQPKAPGDTKEARQLIALCESQGNRCFYCEEPFMAVWPYNATRDHVVPKSQGGGKGENLVAACAECNTAKASAVLRNFLRKYEKANPALLRFFTNMGEAFCFALEPKEPYVRPEWIQEMLDRISPS